MPSPTRLTFLSVFTILSCCLSLALAQSTYYVNQNNPSTSPDGSIENPFNDLSQAFEVLQNGTFELLLLGDNITVSSFVPIPADSDYTIRPASILAGQTHYPLYLQDTSCIQVEGTKLTIEDIQFIEQNYERTVSDMAINLTDGSLTLNRILIRDLEYYNNYYLFLNTASNGVETELTINYGEFYSLANIEIALTGTNLNVLNSVFSNLTETLTPLFIVLDTSGTEYRAICQNNTIQDSTFIYNVDGSGFLYLFWSNFDVLFDGLFIKDVTIQTGTAIFNTQMDLTEQSLGAKTTLTIANSTFQNIFEAENPGADFYQNSSGLVVHMLGDMNLVVSNITLDNINLYTARFLRNDASSSTNFLGTGSLRDITVKNCLRAQFHITVVEGVIERVTLENNTYNSTHNATPIFTFFRTPAALARDFRGINNTGPILFFYEVLIQAIEDFVFYDSKSSQKFDTEQQYLLNAQQTHLRYKDYSPESDGEITTVYRNLQFYGYTEENGINATKTSNDTYLFYIHNEFGKTYLRDSTFKDIEMGAIVVPYAGYFEIDNITMDTNPAIPANEIAKHRALQLIQVKEFIVSNSLFINDRNIIWLSFNYLRRDSLFPDFPSGSLTLDNITVKNNIVVTDPSEPIYTSLWYISSPQKPIKLTIKNSQFINNTIGAGLINTEECAKVDIDLLNNTFKDNYSLKQGSIFVAQSMQQNTSNLNIVNNTFLNNSCFLNGGLFYLYHTKHNIVSNNNIYNLSVARSGGGGVGYLYRTKVDYVETNGTYLATSSNGLGGIWYANVLRNDTAGPSIKFIDTKFYDSSTSKRGGAIFIETGDASFFNCTFKNTRAQEGGIAYVDSWGSISFNKVISTQNYAVQGSILSTGAVFEDTFIIKDSSFADIAVNQTSSNMIVMNYGILIIDNCSFQNVYSSLFKMVSASINITNTKINQIYCINQASACIINAKDSNVSLHGSHIVGVTANRDLMSINGSRNQNTLVVGSSQILNFQKSVGAPSGELFGFDLLQLGSAEFQDSNITLVDISAIKAKQTTLTVSGSKFLSATTGRILQDNILLSSKQSQFILLDSSSSMITDTAFTGGSSSSVNGGAIRLMGEGGNHVIKNSVFEKNQGLNGGAISAQGKINNLQIESSQFRNNAAFNGAGIFIDGEIGGSTVITGSTFEGNNAQHAGTLYSGDNELGVQNSSFNGNRAKSGGAIAYMGSDDNKLTLTANTFNGNNAKLGAAILTLGDLNFQNQGNQFVNNKATYGGDFGSKPSSARLKVYEVQEAFLFIDTASIDYMLAHPATELIYNSQDPSTQQKLYMKTGRSPNYIFEFAILDQLGHLLPIFQQINLEMDIDAKSSASILGTTEYTFTQGGQGLASGFVFNSFYMRGQIGLSVVVTAQMKASVPLLDEAYELPPLSWPIEIASCSEGDIYDSGHMLCSPCSKKTFSIQDPNTTKTCTDCLEHATCLGGNIVFPEPGYWRMDAWSDNIVACANPASCLGGQIDEGRNISLTGFCAEPYSGPGCGLCAPGYVRFGTNAECLSCSKNILDHVRYGAFFAIQAVLAALAVKSQIASVNLTPKERKFETLKSSLTKIVIDFLHVCSVTLAFNLEWPKEVTDFLRFSSEATPTTRDVFTIDCIIAIVQGTNQGIFLIKAALSIIQPLVYICIGIPIWMIIFKTKRRTIIGNDDFKIKIILTIVIVVYILQPDIIKTTFQLFDCVNFGSSINEKYYLKQDPSVECWDNTHITWLLAVAIPSLTLWLVVPCLALLALVTRRNLTGSLEFRKRYHFIFGKYATYRFYWDAMILARKVLLIILMVFLPFSYHQAYFSFVVLVAAYLFQHFYKPYSEPILNSAEKISLVSSGVIMYTGLFFVRDFKLSTVVGLLLVFDIIAGVLFFCFCIFVFKDLALQKINLIHRKLDPVIGSETFRWKWIQKVYKKLVTALQGSILRPDTVNIQNPLASLGLNTLKSDIPDLLPFPKLSLRTLHPNIVINEFDQDTPNHFEANKFNEKTPNSIPSDLSPSKFSSEQIIPNYLSPVKFGSEQESPDGKQERGSILLKQLKGLEAHSDRVLSESEENSQIYLAAIKFYENTPVSTPNNFKPSKFRNEQASPDGKESRGSVLLKQFRDLEDPEETDMQQFQLKKFMYEYGENTPRTVTDSAGVIRFNQDSPTSSPYCLKPSKFRSEQWSPDTKESRDSVLFKHLNHVEDLRQPDIEQM